MPHANGTPLLPSAVPCSMKFFPNYGRNDMQYANGMPSGMSPGMRRADGVSCRHAHANGMPSADFTDGILKCDQIPPVVIQLCLWDFLLMTPCVTRIASGDAFCPWDFLIILG